jgi:hypothetical protein
MEFWDRLTFGVELIPLAESDVLSGVRHIDHVRTQGSLEASLFNMLCARPIGQRLGFGVKPPERLIIYRCEFY